MAITGVTIQIDPAQMTTVAKIIDAQRAVIENTFGGIFNDAKALQNDWEGDSAETYQKEMGTFVDMTKAEALAPQIVSILKAYVVDLDAIAAQYVTTEQTNTAEDQALPSNVFGV